VFTLDPNTGRLQGYQFNVGSNSDTGTLRWNANGSLYQLAINDTIPGTQDTQTCTYAHDDLARVASVNCSNGATNKWNQTFNYDAFGNISKGSSGPGITFAANYLLTGGGTNNQITSLPGVTPTYDASGRMTYDGAHTYAWDAESKMVSVDTTTVTYDALGRMVEKNVSGTYTQVVYGPQGGKFAVMNGQTLVQAFIPLPTGAKAVYTLAGLAFYRHHDHLGSSRLATTPSRTLYSSTAYAPFGEPYAQAGTTDLSFTGQDQDTVSGMHDFLDRRYMPVQGRWLSPDPMGLDAVDPTSPQSWNRYAYVVNNPLAMIDPLGDDGCYGIYVPFPIHCNIGVNDNLALEGQWGDPFAVNSFGATTVTVKTGWALIGIMGGTVIAGGCPADATGCSVDEVATYDTYTFYPYLGAGNNVSQTPPPNSGGGAATGFAGFNMLARVKANYSQCTAAFHQTTVGKVAQVGSIVALTPANGNYAANWDETVSFGTLKAAFFGGMKGASKEVGEMAEEVIADVAYPFLLAATGTDTAATLGCAGSAVQASIPFP